MGYSAALNVALAKAVNLFLKLKLNDGEINKIAYIGECLIHGTPSGIDNTCATFGSLIWFIKNNQTLPIKSPRKLYFVLGNTGIKHDTKKAIGLVRQYKKKHPKLFGEILSEEKSILLKAKTAIENSDLKNIGLLMNKNQELLRKVGVSCQELETFIDTCQINGTLGAKLTGAGCGGSAIALCKNYKHQKVVMYKCMKIGLNCSHFVIQ